MDSTVPFGGKVIVFGGDLGQILPVMRGADRAELVANSLPSWEHWSMRHELSLTVNHRAENDAEFLNGY